MSAHYGICDCPTCVLYNNKKLVALEKAHAWLLSQTDGECVEWGCPVDEGLHFGSYCDDGLSWRHAQGCDWVKARDLKL